MTDAERKLLIWCAILLMRITPRNTTALGDPDPGATEAEEIFGLIADVRRQMEVWNKKD